MCRSQSWISSCVCVDVKFSQASLGYAEQWMLEDESGRAVHGPPLVLGGEIRSETASLLDCRASSSQPKSKGDLVH